MEQAATDAKEEAGKAKEKASKAKATLDAANQLISSIADAKLQKLRAATIEVNTVTP